jgi:hypothetical protein
MNEEFDTTGQEATTAEQEGFGAGQGELGGSPEGEQGAPDRGQGAFRGAAEGDPGAPKGEQGAPLFGGGSDLATRWQSVQVEFVDEPQRALQDADRLVSDVMGQLTETFRRQREELERTWKAGGEVTTEDLRLALQRYHSFFDRLLAA